MPIPRPALGLVTNRLDRWFEKGLGGGSITGRAEQRVDQITLAVNGPIPGMPVTLQLNVGFVHLPAVAGRSASLGLQLPAQPWREAFLPLPHRFMREGLAADQEHLSQVAQAQLIAPSPQHDP
jgi:hypothetical protein